MKRPGLAAALYVSLVFLSGAVVGIFGDRLYTAKTVNANVNVPRPADYRQKYVEEMTKRLRLTPEQVTELGAILDDTRNKFHEEHDRSKQQLAQIHDEQVQKIHEILASAQLPEYEKFRVEREKDRELREKNSKDKQPK
jgi:Spy/CpxP family protein refolding chaperone